MIALTHMSDCERDAYCAFLLRLARRAGARMRDHLTRAADELRNPWGFL